MEEGELRAGRGGALRLVHVDIYQYCFYFNMNLLSLNKACGFWVDVWSSAVSGGRFCLLVFLFQGSSASWGYTKVALSLLPLYLGTLVPFCLDSRRT